MFSRPQFSLPPFSLPRLSLPPSKPFPAKAGAEAPARRILTQPTPASAFSLSAGCTGGAWFHGTTPNSGVPTA